MPSPGGTAECSPAASARGKRRTLPLGSLSPAPEGRQSALSPLRGWEEEKGRRERRRVAAPVPRAGAAGLHSAAPPGLGPRVASGGDGGLRASLRRRGGFSRRRSIHGG